MKRRFAQRMVRFVLIAFFGTSGLAKVERLNILLIVCEDYARELFWYAD